MVSLYNYIHRVHNIVNTIHIITLRLLIYFSNTFITRRLCKINKITYIHTMTDPFKLSRKVSATVTTNLHTMDHYKLPLTKHRNETLGHPKQWQPCISPNMDASIAKQLAAKTREHTPFTNSKAYTYGKLPLHVKPRETITFEVTNPMIPDVKQLYRSARRYPNEYNARNAERKLTMNEAASRLPLTKSEFQGTEDDVRRLNLGRTTMDSSFSYPNQSTWRVPEKPEGMNVSLRRFSNGTGRIDLSPRHKVEGISYLPQKVYRSTSSRIHNDPSIMCSTNALEESKGERINARTKIIRNNIHAAKNIAHDAEHIKSGTKAEHRTKPLTSKNLLVLPNPASLGNKVEAGKVFRIKLKMKNISNQAIRPLCKIIYTNNLYTEVKENPHTLAPGATKHIVLEVASPFKGNCECVLNITDRRNDEDEESTKVVIFGSTIIPGKKDNINNPEEEDEDYVKVNNKNNRRRRLSHMELSDPSSSFRRHISGT